MSNGNGNMASPRNISQRKQVKNALERLDEAEQKLEGFIYAFNQAVVPLAPRIEGMEEVLQAVANIIGLDKIQNEVALVRKKKLEEKMAAEKVGIDTALLNGQIVQADKVSDASVIIGAEYDVAGEVKIARVQTVAANLRPEYKDKIMGQGVGTEIDVMGPEVGEDGKPIAGPDGAPILVKVGTFKITEIYDAAPPPEVAVPASAEGATAPEAPTLSVVAPTAEQPKAAQ